MVIKGLKAGRRKIKEGMKECKAYGNSWGRKWKQKWWKNNSVRERMRTNCVSQNEINKREKRGDREERKIKRKEMEKILVEFKGALEQGEKREKRTRPGYGKVWIQGKCRTWNEKLEILWDKRGKVKEAGGQEE